MNLNSLEWIRQIFNAKAVQDGGVLKRKITSVTKHASEAQLLAEAKRRGVHVVKSDTHYLIFCSSPLRVKRLC